MATTRCTASSRSFARLFTPFFQDSTPNVLPRLSHPQPISSRTYSRLAGPRMKSQKALLAQSLTSGPQKRNYPTYKTVEGAKSRNRTGPFSVIGLVMFVGAGGGLTWYFQSEKEKQERLRIAEHAKGIGKPKVGGPFVLTDQDGNVWDSEKDMKGKFALIYFGFSHCPDICPEELDKMAEALDLVKVKLAKPSGGINLFSKQPPPQLLPLFVTCDPARDTPEVLKKYLKEFSPELVGLTGSWNDIKQVCKLYRVYFSTPEGVKPGMDYLVDHSIYFYLMDPDGDFVEAIGRQHTPEAASTLIADHMKDWASRH